MILRKVIKFFTILFLLNGASLMAQPEPEDIAAVTDEFQEHFYEALKQKGIENYDRAITALDKCLKLEPNNAILHFELGKNYLLQKDYSKAYAAFEKASVLDPKNMWALAGMYDVCYETRDFNKAIEVVNRLIVFKKEYKEDLTSLYMNTHQFDKALELINELNDQVGRSEARESYKAQILRDAKYQGSEKSNLLEQIRKNPKEESNYIALIYLYSESNQEEKAMEIARQLEKEIPSSDWAQVSLFKFNLNNQDGEKAVASMNAVFKSKKIDNKIKHRILNEFLIFAKDQPKYDADLDKAISYFDSDKDVRVAKEVAKFYHSKNSWDKAIRFYEKHLKSTPDDVEASILLMEAYAEKGQFQPMAAKADAMLELFPLQPQFYYYSGLANNQLKNHKKAKEMLQTGLDYLVDDLPLEANFNIQLGEAFNALGDQKQKEVHFKKAEMLLQKLRKK